MVAYGYDELQLGSYRHKPLKPNQFRLCTIQSALDLESPLVIEIRVYSLDGYKPRWDAISYCYGDTVLTHQVYIDGQIHCINASAYSALKHCRYHDSPRTVWLDQICMSQSDEEEKLEQIPLMGRIFQGADSVVVYLGDAWLGLERYFDFLNVIGSTPRMWHIDYWRPRTIAPEDFPLKVMFNPDRKFSRSVWERLQAMATDGYMDSLIHHHDRILCAPWFPRLWVVQEASLARNLQIQYSSLTASWDAFMIARDRFFYGTSAPLEFETAWGLRSACSIETLRLRFPCRRAPLSVVWPDFKWHLKACTSIVDCYRLIVRCVRRLWTVTYPDSISLLRDFRTQQSTDFRDKVFGLLGLTDPNIARSMVSHWRQFNSSPPHSSSSSSSSSSSLVPDENSMWIYRTISGVSYTFAVEQILRNDNLDVLHATCMNAKAHEDLPFWVPDWSFDHPPCDTMYAFSLNRIPHCAGTQYPARADFITSENAIVLTGIKIDEVVEVLDDVLSIHDLHDPSLPIWKVWEDFAIKVPLDPESDPYGDEAGRYNAFWRTLMYDTDGAGGRARADQGHKFTQWSRGEFVARSGMASSVTGRIVLNSRRLFRTKRGYIGNACCEVKVGDPVYVLRGGKLPFVLRRDRVVEGMTIALEGRGNEPVMKKLQGYKMVGGDAYVHGFADGEVWEFAEREGIELEEIALV